MSVVCGFDKQKPRGFVVRKGMSSVGTWNQLISLYGNMCAYCHREVAQSVDHVIPWSYSYDNSIDNLRPCCLWCNLTLSDKLFESFEAKQAYIRKMRSVRDRMVQTVCTTCFLPFQRPHMTTSLFECPDCDPSKSTGIKREKWLSFKHLMQDAGIQIALHSEIRELFHDGCSLRVLKERLAQRYIEFNLGLDLTDATVADLQYLGLKSY